MRRGRRSIALWLAVAALAVLGLAASLSRAIGVIDSVLLADGPVPELSRLDHGGTRFMAGLLGAAPASAGYEEIDRQNRRMLGKFNRHPTATLLHVLPAALFVVLAPLQFSRRIRARRPRWHRWAGRTLVAIAVPIGLSGLFFGLLMPFAGALEASAIAVFGGIFLVSALRGLAAIRAGRVAAHREWMIRMFAVALGASTVRLVGIALAAATRLGPEAWFGHSVWLGFAGTSLAAELWIRGTRSAPRASAAPTPAGGAVAAPAS